MESDHHREVKAVTIVPVPPQGALLGQPKPQLWAFICTMDSIDSELWLASL